VHVLTKTLVVLAAILSIALLCAGDRVTPVNTEPDCRRTTAMSGDCGAGFGGDQCPET